MGQHSAVNLPGTSLIGWLFGAMKANARCFSLCVPLAFYPPLLFIALSQSYPLRSNSEIPEEILAKHLRPPEFQETFLEENRDLSPVHLLTVIFQQVDKDGDTLVSMDELSGYIQDRTKDHIDRAMQENYGLFMIIDKDPRNGVISWKEYHGFFLQQHGVDEEYIREHTEKHPGLGRSLKETMARDRASWSEAARSDPDFLTLDEFLAFRHPESSHATILALVDDLLDKLDRDGDESLTEEEFALLDGMGVRPQGEMERRAEFKTFIDTDRSGRADRNELLRYIDPKNPRHAREEAGTLIALSDVDHDGYLTLEEVLSKADLFLGSKMVDTARSFHDEF